MIANENDPAYYTTLSIDVMALTSFTLGYNLSAVFKEDRFVFGLAGANLGELASSDTLTFILSTNKADFCNTSHFWIYFNDLANFGVSTVQSDLVFVYHSDIPYLVDSSYVFTLPIYSSPSVNNIDLSYLAPMLGENRCVEGVKVESCLFLDAY